MQILEPLLHSPSSFILEDRRTFHVVEALKIDPGVAHGRLSTNYKLEECRKC